MEAAKAAIAKHTSRRGHFTDVTETIRPAVTYETVKPHVREIATTAIDKEVHKHHYHTTVQPLSHSEILPAVHTHNLIPIEHKVHRHHDENETKERVARDLARFVDVSVTLPTTHSQSVLPQVVGEHVHHHVHETVQPIIYKETITKDVVHTTIPIYESHHNKSVHHHMSALPLVTMEQFMHRGGILNGNAQTISEKYEGSPREYNSDLHTTMEKLGLAATVAGGAATTGAMRKKHAHRRDHSDSGVSGISSSESDSDSSHSRRRRERHSHHV